MRRILIVLALLGSAAAAQTYRASCGAALASNPGMSQSCSVAADNGDLIVVSEANISAGAEVAPTDSYGDTYAQLSGTSQYCNSSGSTVCVTLWATTAVCGSCSSATVTWNAISGGYDWGLAASFAALAAAVDGQAQAQAATAVARVAAGPVSTSHAADVLLSLALARGVGGGSPCTADAGWTVLNSSDDHQCGEYKIVSTTQTAISAGPTLTSGDTTASMVTWTFALEASGAAPAMVPRRHGGSICCARLHPEERP